MAQEPAHIVIMGERKGKDDSLEVTYFRPDTVNAEGKRPVWKAGTTHEEKRRVFLKVMSETWKSGATEAVVSPVPRLNVRNRDGSADREHQLQEEVLDLIEGAFFDRAAAAETLLQYNGELATVYILLRKATEEDKETVEKALTPNLKLAERIMAWKDYSEEEREAMVQIAMPIMSKDRAAAEMAVDIIIQEAKESCADVRHKLSAVPIIVTFD
uniref:Uncharacterized protein n=1 Tax=Chloropicon roscoffensis TaxID=1461544 RepID=A0A7S3FTK1_9CHLO